MRSIRIFSREPLRANTRVALDEQASRHVAQVLRMRPGEPLVLFDGRGGEYPSIIRECGRGGVQAEVGARDEIDRESPLRVALWHALNRGDKMDAVVQKATELGVDSIQPLLTIRSIVKLAGRAGEKKRAHWERVAISACEQSGRTRVPGIADPVDLQTALARRAGAEAGAGLLFDPGANDDLATVLGSDWSRAQPVTVLTGPEGGFTPDEVAAATAAGFRAVVAGPRTLRTETAPLVALSLLQWLGGDFRRAR